MCDSCRWSALLGRIAEVQESLGELPDRAEDFSDSVYERLDDIAAWITEHEHCTEAQKTAVERMAAGISRWLEA